MKRAVVFSSKLGSTRKIAERIAEATGADLFDLADAMPDVSGYDWIHLGTGIYAGGPSKRVREFVDANREKMGRTSLFVACMFDDERGDKQLEKVAKEFGVADAAYFNKSKKQVYVPGSKLEEYVSRLVE
ncbi:MAG: hypothetical protein GX224_06845 [Thermoplasmatales archaeon]|nr:hypothetical protein [Thermoplasmatales archaeon]